MARQENLFDLGDQPKDKAYYKRKFEEQQGTTVDLTKSFHSAKIRARHAQEKNNLLAHNLMENLRENGKLKRALRHRQQRALKLKREINDYYQFYQSHKK